VDRDGYRLSDRVPTRLQEKAVTAKPAEIGDLRLATIVVNSVDMETFCD
jgi:hypothetical protein